MTSLISNEEIGIVKADKVGRRQTPAARRERLLDEFDRSGLSAPEFVRLTGLKYSTFAAWVHRRRKLQKAVPSAPAKAADPVRWLEALVESNPPAEGLRAVGLKLELPGRVKLELNDADQLPLLAALLRALESLGGRPPSC